MAVHGRRPRTAAQTAETSPEPVKSGGDDAPPAPFSDTVAATLALFEAGHAPEEIAQARQLAPMTVYGHLAALIESGRLSTEEVVPLPPEERREIESALQALPGDPPQRLKPVYDKFGGKYSYDHLKCIRAGLAG